MHVLVCSKRSQFEIHKKNITSKKDLIRLAKSYEEHIKTKEVIAFVLQKNKIHFTNIYRDDLYKLGSIEGYDLIITCGGDGTFLHTQRLIKKGKILAVNSDVVNSVGYFTVANRFNFEEKLEYYREGKLREIELWRLMLSINKKVYTKRILNDVLVSHEIPSLTSRYEIFVQGKKEIQKSSGVWISTAAGSSGAIHSAGGQRLPLASKNFQFLVREPDFTFGRRLITGIIKPHSSLAIRSRMAMGICYIDGTADSCSFTLGDRLEFRISNEPITLIR